MFVLVVFVVTVQMVVFNRRVGVRMVVPLAEHHGDADRHCGGRDEVTRAERLRQHRHRE